MQRKRIDLTGQRFGKAYRPRTGGECRYQNRLAMPLRLRKGACRDLSASAQRQHQMLRLSAAPTKN